MSAVLARIIAAPIARREAMPLLPGGTATNLPRAVAVPVRDLFHLWHLQQPMTARKRGATRHTLTKLAPPSGSFVFRIKYANI